MLLFLQLCIEYGMNIHEMLLFLRLRDVLSSIVARGICLAFLHCVFSDVYWKCYCFCDVLSSTSVAPGRPVATLVPGPHFPLSCPLS